MVRRLGCLDCGLHVVVGKSGVREGLSRVS